MVALAKEGLQPVMKPYGTDDFLEFPEFSSELELELEIVHAGRGQSL